MSHFAIQCRACGKIALFEQVVNHALEAHGAAIVGTIHPRDAVFVEFLDFVGKNNPTTPGKNANVRTAFFFQ